MQEKKYDFRHETENTFLTLNVIFVPVYCVKWPESHETSSQMTEGYFSLAGLFLLQRPRIANNKTQITGYSQVSSGTSTITLNTRDLCNDTIYSTC